jgi:hypothetical protein
MRLTYSRRLLTTHPNVLQRVREEISTILGEGPKTNVEITYEELRKLTYPSCVLKEGQYCHPDILSIIKNHLTDRHFQLSSPEPVSFRTDKFTHRIENCGPSKRRW